MPEFRQVIITLAKIHFYFSQIFQGFKRLALAFKKLAHILTIHLLRNSDVAAPKRRKDEKK